MSSQQEYVDVIKTAALSMGKRLVIQAIVSKIPWLGNFIFGPIVGWIVGKVLEIAIQKTEMGLFFLYVDLRTSAQGREFQRAALQNAVAQASQDPVAKKEAEIYLIESFKAFAKL